MSEKLRRHRTRRVTDEQIRLLKAWVPFNELARSMGISVRYATDLRCGRVQHKTASP